jgi:hypothetical protein
MSAPVQAYRLPEVASCLDRATLAVWTLWLGWARPALLTTALIVLGHLVLAVATDAVTWPWLGTVPSLGDPIRWWVLGQLVTALAGALAAWPVLRAHPHPTALEAIAGVLAVAAHLVPAQLTTIQEIPRHWLDDALSIVGLWATPVLAAGFGALLLRRRIRHSQPL